MKKCKKCGNYTMNHSLLVCPECQGEMEIVQNSEYKVPWWYSDTKEIKGPCTYHDLIELLQSGLIHKDDFIWTQGMKRWEPIKSSDFFAINVLDTVKDDKKQPLNNSLVWMMSAVPLLLILIQLFLGNDLIVRIICLCFNLVLWMLDKSRVKKAGYNIGYWFLWALLAIPIYLFVRSYKTDKKCGYAIAWVSTYSLYLVVFEICVIYQAFAPLIM